MHAHDYRSGQQFQAGHGVATVLPDFDFETYSEAGYVWNESAQKWDSPDGFSPNKKGLGAVGTMVYTNHPTFEVLSLYYDLKDGRGPQRWIPNVDPAPQDLFDHVANGGALEAWNVGFERRVWWACQRLYGWPPLPESALRCAMAKSRAYALPGKLDKAAEVLRTTRKNPEGDALLKRFAMPVKPTNVNGQRRRILPMDDPIGFGGLCGYNRTDIAAEAEVSIRVPDLSPLELAYWRVDQAINNRGCRVDLQTVHAAVKIIAQASDRYGVEFRALTGLSPTQTKKFVEWVSTRGYPIDSVDEENTEELLARKDLDAVTRRAVELRALVASASIKKVFSMLHANYRERVYDLFSFHAAHTGRPTGNDPQPTNMPKAGPDVWQCMCGKHYGVKAKAPGCPWCGHTGSLARAYHKQKEWNPEAMVDAIEVLRSGDLDTVEWYFGEAYLTLVGSLRGLFIAADGHDLVSSDYTAIEAVVLACLSGEQWRIDLFRNKGKIYEASGALVMGLSYEEVIAYPKFNNGQKHPARQVGKVAELALGYQGWVGAWRQFEDKNKDPMPEEDVNATILKWRAKSPAIVEFWGGQSRRIGRLFQTEFYGVEGAFIKAALKPGTVFTVGQLQFVAFAATTPDLRGNPVNVQIILPSGRRLTYHDVRLLPAADKRRGSTYDIHYWRWNTNPKNGKVNAWIEVKTWGGRLVENIVQAVSNDILRWASMHLEMAGYPIVLHVYDEIVSEIRKGWGSIEEFERIMSTLPHWAVLPNGERWPINVDGGWRGTNYRKG